MTFADQGLEEQVQAALICLYFHFGPSALLSDLSQMCACVKAPAEVSPEEVSFSRCCRSALVRARKYIWSLGLAFLVRILSTRKTRKVPAFWFTFDRLPGREWKIIRVQHSQPSNHRRLTLTARSTSPQFRYKSRRQTECRRGCRLSRRNGKCRVQEGQ